MKKFIIIAVTLILILGIIIFGLVKYSDKGIAIVQGITSTAQKKDTNLTDMQFSVQKIPITHADLFKNSWALITRTIEIGKDNPTVDFEIDSEMMHGSLRILPQGTRILRTTRKVPVKNQAGMANSWFELFAGKEVTLELNDKTSVTGRMLIPDFNGKDGNIGDTPGKLAMHGKIQPQFITVKCQDGTYYTVNSANISAVKSNTESNPTDEAGIPQLTEEKAFFRLIPPADYSGPVTVTYLTKGLFWTPSYCFNLEDENLTIEGNMEICNQLEDLNDVEIRCISGYPNLEMSNVSSPLSPHQTPDRFLQAASVRMQSASGNRNDGILSQASILSNSAGNGTLAGLPGADGFVSADDTNNGDMEFLPIGKLSIRKGDTLHMQTGNGSTKYEQIVLFRQTQPFNRSHYDSVSAYNSNREPNTIECYEAIRFKNPMQTAITTAPTIFFRGNNILGQSVNHHVAPVTESVFRITKSMSCFAEEKQTVVRDEDRIIIGNSTYTPRIIAETVTVRNTRPLPVTAIIALNLVGAVIDVDESAAKPVITPVFDSVSSVNPVNEFRWEVKIQPGQTIELKQNLRVLVP